MNFDDVIARVLANEGGYVNNPADPGGETNFGISKHAYPDVDIANLTRDQAAAIYKRDFWDKMQLDLQAPAIGYQLLDFAVNAGVGTAIRVAQSVLDVAPDGNWGPISQQALANANSWHFQVQFPAAKIRYYTKLSTFPTFGTGWMNRVAQDLDYAGSDAA
jgi:lysozyme family protein